MINYRTSVLIHVTRFPKSLQQPRKIMGSSPVLKQLYSEALNLLSLQSVIRDHFNADVSVASLDNKTLLLITHSSAVATQLRYRQRNITSLVRQQCRIDINTIKISVRPVEVREKPPTSNPLPPSKENARNLANIAGLIEHDGLRNALIKLSKRSKQGGCPRTD